MPQYIGYRPTGTANSSVTTSSLTDIYTSLYLNMDGANNSTTFTDLSPNALTITPNDNSHISTVQSKFGGASVFLDGTGDHLRIPSNTAPLVLTGDFTIECFCRTTTTVGDRVLLVLNYDSSAAQEIFRSGTSLLLYSSSGASGWDISNGRTIGTMTADVWHHVAVTRSGNIYNLYLDGVRNTTFSSSLTPKSTGTKSSVGSLVSPTGYEWTGYVDDLRITKGIALYTGATLTVPTSAVTKNINALVVDRKYNSGVWTMDSIFTKILASNWPNANRGLRIVTLKVWGAGGGGSSRSGAAGGNGGIAAITYFMPTGVTLDLQVPSGGTGGNVTNVAGVGGSGHGSGGNGSGTGDANQASGAGGGGAYVKIQGGATLISAGGGGGAGSHGYTGGAGTPRSSGATVSPSLSGGAGSINGGAGGYSASSHSGGGGGGGDDGSGTNGGGAGAAPSTQSSGGRGYFNTTVYEGVRDTTAESSMTPKAGGAGANPGLGGTGATGQIEIIVNGVSNSYTSAGSFSLTI